MVVSWPFINQSEKQVRRGYVDELPDRNVNVCPPFGSPFSPSLPLWILVLSLLGSVESTDDAGIGRQNDGIEAGECAYAQDTLPLREASGVTRSKAY